MTMFAVDTAGFRELMASRPKWQFVRELVSNSLDEASVNNISVLVTKEPRYATIEVTDDGNGFARLSDAYTLFAPTPKRSNVKVRGRFNMGEKELASISKKMEVSTTTGTIRFEGGKRSNHPRIKRESGTIVTATIPMSNSELHELVDMIQVFIIPSDKKLTFELSGSSPVVIGDRSDDLLKEVTETLATTLLSDGEMRSTKRLTKVSVYKRFYGENSHTTFLYELGIPVQEIDCPYNVNVDQKVPMNANRDAVRDSYLQDIYAIVLNSVHGELDETTVSEAWVKTASDDDLTSDDAFTSIKNTRYGEKSLRWSSNTQANEDAMSQGYAIIHPKQMSATERSRFDGVGMISASVNFTRDGLPYDLIVRKDWTESMKTYEKISHHVCAILKIGKVKVAFIESEAGTLADYNSLHHKIRNNVSNWEGKRNFDPFNFKFLGYLIHELAHMVTATEFSHGPEWYKQLERFSGKVLRQLLLEAPIKGIKGRK